MAIQNPNDTFSENRLRRSFFGRLAGNVARGAGTWMAFSAALASVLLWAACGPFFNYSEKWQMFIGVGPTIVTFLMVFLIQQTQNKDSIAIHLKLNELLASHREASNRVVGIEDLDEKELIALRTFYCQLAEQAAAAQRGVKEARSLDEADLFIVQQGESNRSTFESISE